MRGPRGAGVARHVPVRIGVPGRVDALGHVDLAGRLALVGEYSVEADRKRWVGRLGLEDPTRAGLLLDGRGERAVLALQVRPRGAGLADGEPEVRDLQLRRGRREGDLLVLRGLAGPGPVVECLLRPAADPAADADRTTATA